MEEHHEILDSDDEPLKDNHDNDNIYVDSEDEALAEALAASRTAPIEIPDEDDVEEDESLRTGWGECPMCTEVMLPSACMEDSTVSLSLSLSTIKECDFLQVDRLNFDIFSCSDFLSCSCTPWPARVLVSTGEREATWSTPWM